MFWFKVNCLGNLDPESTHLHRSTTAVGPAFPRMILSSSFGVPKNWLMWKLAKGSIHELFDWSKHGRYGTREIMRYLCRCSMPCSCFHPHKCQWIYKHLQTFALGLRTIDRSCDLLLMCTWVRHRNREFLSPWSWDPCGSLANNIKGPFTT